jgi:alpha-amylase/alpha-mannosidase (GH57 family)
MDRFICLHGHFYQPPRENPWLEAIELQDSAYPYHDWNTRITAQCYTPNGVSRILDDEQNIESIVNNYSRISFDFGPTLLSWMEQQAPDTYGAILDADDESRRCFSGHGSAIAQAYNHMILPLANRRDRETQVLWGVRDFQRRFGRPPEGMWLPETAVDLESLDLLAEHGIRFTILSPDQAARVRKIGSKSWLDVSGGRIDPSRAYLQNLPSGRSIAIFFYDGPVSHAVAFERLLTRGEDLAHRLVGGFSDDRTWPQLMHIATDGESYGHHHRHGDMALAYALSHIDGSDLARLCNYGEFLEKHLPTHEVDVLERTSWSCAHGVDRWWSNCGCSSGGNPDLSQAWRQPLREALDWLRDEIAPLYEHKGSEIFVDPWQARNDYIDVILDRSRENVQGFLTGHGRGDRSPESDILRLKLLELQRHAQLMYTSCGWFFDDLSGLETVQVIQYAGRVVQLARETFGDHLENGFLAHLEKCKSNSPEHGDGRAIYEKRVRPTMLDLSRVGAHYAVSSLFEEHPEEARIYCYDAERDAQVYQNSGRMKLSAGRTVVTSTITWESSTISFAALHMGDHNIAGGVRFFLGQQPYEDVVGEITDTFSRADVPAVIHLFKEHFGESTFSLRSLFRDEQRRFLTLLLKDAFDDAASVYQRVYEKYAPFMRLLTDAGMPIPRAFGVAAERALNRQIEAAFEEEEFDPESIRRLLNEVDDLNVALDGPTLAFTLQTRIQQMAQRLSSDPTDPSGLDDLEAAVDIIRSLPFEVDLWHVQNVYHQLLRSRLDGFRSRAMDGDASASQWVNRFVSLGRRLRMRVE